MDINAYLKQVTTAPLDNGASSESWLRGRKRRAERAEGDGKGTPPTTSSSSLPKLETAVGLDMEELRAELAKERLAAAVETRQRDVGTARASEQESAKRAHLILDYVMTRELGGRHNAAKGDGHTAEGTDSNPRAWASQLAAERAKLRAAAAYDIQYAVHEPQQGVGAYSEVHRARVPDGVVAYRKSTKVCDVRTDLVGGLLSGMAPHLRAYALKVVEAGLRGEAWTRADTADADSFAASKSPKPEALSPSSVAAPMVLFEDAAKEGAALGDTAAFSLEDFLRPETSDEDTV